MMTATWTVRCDNCDRFRHTELKLNEITAQETQGYTDIWGPGFGDGWIQIPFDKITGRHYLFFHNRDCYEAWLRGQGRHAEADAFTKAIRIA